MSGEHAQFEPAEQQAIRDAVAAGKKAVCPRDGAIMTARASAAARSGWATPAGGSG